MDETAANQDPPAGRVRIASGAQAAERDLLDRVLALCEEARRDPALLARPVRIVVPSRSLREHLAARLAQEVEAGAAAGVLVQSLFGLACEVLRRRGEEVSSGGQLLFPVLVRRLARDEPLLRDALDELRDGYGSVTAAVADLLDAGMEVAHAEALDEALSQAPADAVRERARSVVRVALRSLEIFDALGLSQRSGVLRRAADLLANAPALLPARAVLVHGFADATGVASDCLEALVRHAGASVWIDHPPDPAGEVGGQEPGPGAAFTERLVGRLQAAGLETAPEAPQGVADPRAIALQPAPGAHAEARAVCEEIAALIDAGASPESIGIVVRDLGPYRVPLAVQLRRLGIPFSGGRGLVGAAGRRLRALLELLEREEACPADRWLDARDLAAQAQAPVLRLALHSMGVGRLAQLADLDLDRRLLEGRDLPLPVRVGLVASTPPGDGAAGSSEATRPRRRLADRALLERAVADAERACLHLRRLRRAEQLGEWIEALRALVQDCLCWGPGTKGDGELSRALHEIEAGLSAELALDAAEMRMVLARQLRRVEQQPLGGAGAGVQLMDATAARARTFSHLFLMGMNRDVFPRTVVEDPLLPDPLRLRIEPLLPEVPLKRRGFDEERHLFGELCSSAPRVHISWQEVSDEGRERPISPLVERLRLAGAVRVERSAPLVLGPRGEQGRRPAFEHVVVASLAGGHRAFRAMLPVALEPRLGSAGAARLAEVRAAVLAEQDPRDARRHGVGPFHGLVGRPAAADPRRADVWVTELERTAGCPWRAFLERILGLEPLPDALESLPVAEPHLVGSVVHHVLELIVWEAGAARGGSLEDCQGAAPVRISWPAAGALARQLQRAAREVAWREGVAHPAAPVLLGRMAQPFIERIRELEWGPDGVLGGVLAAEVEGRVHVADGLSQPSLLHFRADRLDVCGDALWLTDYKTGTPISDAKKEATRSAKLLDAIQRGRQLQAAAYAFCAAKAPARGRYLFARPQLADDAASLELDGADAEARAVFTEAVAALLDLRREGGFVPRLVRGPGSDEEPGACARCRVADACHRGETGARQRLFSWLQRDEEMRAKETPEEHAARAVLAMEERR